ncbi:MAG TPA: lipid-A-disaccharide synthase [Gemmatimonadaceae bacterium]|nr:lipid-A-disaccharide synthase [Gemmatimonadaceae bacterium]
MREVMIVAGETSGDLHAAGLAAALKARHPDWRLTGMGGARMVAAGVDVAERTDTTAVMGFVEVLRTIPRHYALLKTLGRRLEGGAVKCLVTIDYPGFNLRLAAAAQKAGVPVVYYITPQVWAWGADRLPKMAQLITKAAVILPFEEELLRRHGIDATFVGHPLLDRVAGMPGRTAARASLGLSAEAPVLALFPGSRQQEIDRHLDDFVRTAAILEQRHRGLQVVVATAPGVVVPADRCPYRQVTESSFTVLRAADAAVCKSGTTTLEAAVAGCPLVVAYRTSRWTHAIARRVVRIPRIGLVNVVAGREVAREFVQSAVVPAAMADAVGPLLVHGSPERTQMEHDLAMVRDKLGAPGAAGRVADIVSALVK